MPFKSREFKFSRIDQDGFPIILTAVAVLCAYFAAEILVQPDKDINKGSLLIYITIATLSSSIIDPILTLFKIEKKRGKFFSIGIGMVISLSVFLYTILHSQIFFEQVLSFSRRGGFTAISVTLLLLQLATMNYDTQIDAEDKLREEIASNRKEMIDTRKELIEAKNEIIRLRIKQKNDDLRE